MAASAESYTLTIGDLEQVVPMAFPDGETERQLNARLRSGDDRAIKVRIAPASDADVEGHALAGAERSLVIKVGLDEDDTEGHAISVHFPTAAEAETFRRRLVAAGLLTGTIAIGSVGAVAIANMPTASSDVSFPANTAVYERPAGHGLLEGVDVTDAAPAAAAAAATTQVGGIDPATGKPARSGMLEGVEGGVANASATAAAAEATGIDPATGKPARSGFIEGVDGGLAGGGASLGSSTAERPAGHGPLEGVDR